VFSLVVVGVVVGAVVGVVVKVVVTVVVGSGVVVRGGHFVTAESEKHIDFYHLSKNIRLKMLANSKIYMGFIFVVFSVITLVTNSTNFNLLKTKVFVKYT
jgi:hypothetical protein